MSDTAAEYWEPLWASGRTYRPLFPDETRMLARHLGPGHRRPALDLGCGDGTLARHLHHELGYTTTGVDCSPSAITRARAATRAGGPGGEPRFLLWDFTTGDPAELPHEEYAVLTCRLAYAFVPDQHAFVERARALLRPAGILWVVTELAERCTPTSPGRGITPGEVRTLTTGWTTVIAEDLDHLRCYALHR